MNSLFADKDIKKIIKLNTDIMHTLHYSDFWDVAKF